MPVRDCRSRPAAAFIPSSCAFRSTSFSWMAPSGYLRLRRGYVRGASSAAPERDRCSSFRQGRWRKRALVRPMNWTLNSVNVRSVAVQGHECMRIEVAGITHVGMKRNHNEDSYLMLPEHNLFCVADGMGGHSSGEIASKIAVDELSEFFRMTAKDQDATWPYKMDKTRNYDENRLATGIKLANIRIFERANSDQKFRGMGTTIVSLYFNQTYAYVGHVGDS